MAARLRVRLGGGFDDLAVDDLRVHTRVAAIQPATSGILELAPGRDAVCM